MNTDERIVIDRQREVEIFESEGQIWITVENSPDRVCVALNSEQAKQLEKAIAAVVARLTVSQ